MACFGPVTSPPSAAGEGANGGRTPATIPDGRRVGTPLPARAPATAENDRVLLGVLRRFQLGDARAGESLAGVAGCVPALISPYREASKLRFDYPLLLHGAIPVLAEHAPHQISTPLADLLRIATASIGDATAGGRILHDNLARLEGIVQELLDNAGAPAPATELLAQAAERLQSELALDPQNRSRLGSAIDQLLAMLPPEVTLLGYSRHASMYLLLHAIRHRLVPRHERLFETLNGLAQHLRDLLRVEQAKGENRQAEHHVQQRVGSAGARFLDAAALSRVVGEGRGSEPLAAHSRRRIEQALGVIETYLATQDVRLVTVVHDGLLDEDTFNDGLPSILHSTPKRRYRVEVRATPAPWLETETLFDEHGAQLARIIGAVRTAQLETEALHDLAPYEPWLDTQSWKDLTREELQLTPAVVALVSGDLVLGDGMLAVSSLLRSGRPVQLLVETEPAFNVGALSEEQTLVQHRLEIGYLGLCHRQTWVQQSTAARPQHLIAGYLTALDEARTGLHILSAEGTAQRFAAPSIHPWLATGSAIEARVHPLFQFHPSGTRGVGDVGGIGRLDLQGNPQPQCDWPAHELHYLECDGTQQSLTLQFTFADFALLHSELHQHFRLVPEGFESDTLVPVATYLSGERHAKRQALPFIWVVKAGGQLRQAVVARELLLATEDRQNYWQTLQAFAGVRNPYVEKAQRQMQAEALERFAAERKQLEARHRAELEQVRKETAGQAMKRLAEMLLGLDLKTGDVVHSATAEAPPVLPTATSPEAVPKSQHAAVIPAALPSDESAGGLETLEMPWVDTPLCTSCNDCININRQLFVYDENKQAHIDDPRAGTYAQLVEAAEQCPARCIHPGLPLNPNEPDVDALIARASPFN